jgi:hypothetical protein
MRVKAVITVVIFSLLILQLEAAKPAKADTPFLVAAAASAVGAVVGGWILGSGGKSSSCVTVTTTIYVNGEAVTFTRQVCTITVSPSPPVAGVIEVPLPQPDTLPKGFMASEGDITFGPVQTDDGVQVVTNYTDLDYKADVSGLRRAGIRQDEFRDVQGRKLASDQALYAVNRTTDFGFHAPPTTTAPPAKPKAVFSITASDLTVGTVDLPDTNGSSSYEWIIQSPELGILFYSQVIVLQGFPPIIAGDIPASAFKLSRGKAVLQEFLRTAEVELPDGLTEVNFTVSFNIVGDGVKTGLRLPNQPMKFE